MTLRVLSSCQSWPATPVILEIEYVILTGCCRKILKIITHKIVRAIYFEETRRTRKKCNPQIGTLRLHTYVYEMTYLVGQF